MNNVDFLNSFIDKTYNDTLTALGLPIETDTASSSSANNPPIIQYTDRSINIGSRNTSYRQSNARYKTKSEEKQAQADQAKWIGSIVTIVGAAILGFTFKQFGKTWTELGKTRDAKKIVDKLTYEATKNAPPQTYFQSELNILVVNKLAIDSIEYAKARNYLLSSIGILAGGGLLAIGGFTATPLLITAGSVAILAAAAFATFNLCYHWNDHSDQIKLHLNIKNAYSNAKNELQHIPLPPPPYTPPGQVPSAPPKSSIGDSYNPEAAELSPRHS